MNLRDYPVERFVAFVLGTLWGILGALVLIGALVLALLLAGWQAIDY